MMNAPEMENCAALMPSGLATSVVHGVGSQRVRHPDAGSMQRALAAGGRRRHLRWHHHHHLVASRTATAFGEYKIYRVQLAATTRPATASRQAPPPPPPLEPMEGVRL
uniref:Uncharacterized protein n=1 Tax=Oryza sativa subsp. japonica TaxID=39947 RepID=Q5Z5F0_ORYSJ|nr:hypothetical protein [Oryza sativa Japonica Group]